MFNIFRNLKSFPFFFFGVSIKFPFNKSLDANRRKGEGGGEPPQKASKKLGHKNAIKV
jgi:hypothetical protein